jgi:hypothetical protein
MVVCISEVTLGYDLGYKHSNSGRGRDFSFHRHIKTGSGIHTVSYLIGIRGSFPWVKQPEPVSDNSLPSSPDVKNVWGYTFTSAYVFIGIMLNESQRQLYL